MSTTNLHEPPRVGLEHASASGIDAEAVRRAHLVREASMQALGLLYYFLGAAVLLATVYALITGSNTGLEIRPGVWGAVDLSVYVIGVVVTLVVGSGVRRLRPWARIAAIVICSVGLLRVPIGTLLFPYFLYLLLSAKGKRVFSRDYAAIVAATAHLKYPRSVVVWTVLAVIGVVTALYALRFAIRG